MIEPAEPRTSLEIDPFLEYHAFLSKLRETGEANGRIKPPTSFQEMVAKQLVALTTHRGGVADLSDVTEFVKRITRKSRACFSTLILTSFYLDRLWSKVPVSRSPNSLEQLPGTLFSFGGKGEVIAAMILADKYLYDVAMSNSEWARVSLCFTTAQVNTFEREILGHLGFNLQFSQQDFDAFLSYTEIAFAVHEDRTVNFNEVLLTPAQFQNLKTDPLSEGSSKLINQILSSHSPHTTFLFFNMVLMCCASYCAIIFSVGNSLQLKALESPKPEKLADSSPAFFQWDMLQTRSFLSDDSGC